MKRYIVIVIGVVALIVAPAGASHQRRRRAPGDVSFSGSCSLTGIVRFQPSLTNMPQPVRDVASATGTCSGTLTGEAGRARAINQSRVSYLASDSASNTSCALGAGATGTGELLFSTAVVHFRLSETRVAALAELSMTGSHGGSAFGAANVNASANVPQTIQDCLGAGLAQVPVDLHLQTSPALSG